MFLKDLYEHRSPRASGELLGELGPNLPLSRPHRNFPGCSWFTPASLQVIRVCRAENQVCCAGNQRNPDAAGTLRVRTEQPPG